METALTEAKRSSWQSETERLRLSSIVKCNNTSDKESLWKHRAINSTFNNGRMSHESK